MVGLFFGSFNPIHLGHLGIARYLLDHSFCREIWFVVSPRNPFKQDLELLPEQKRFAIVQMALAAEPRMKACDVELTMPKPSFTIDTLHVLSGRYPGQRFALIIGGDNLRDFHLWRDYQAIAANYKIWVYPRPDIDVTGISYENTQLVDAPLCRISSTQIRQMICRGENIGSYVPHMAEELIINSYKHLPCKK